MFRRKIIQSIEIKESGFGIEPETTAKINGKKGFRTVYAVLQYNHLRQLGTVLSLAGIPGLKSAAAGGSLRDLAIHGLVGRHNQSFFRN